MSNRTLTPEPARAKRTPAQSDSSFSRARVMGIELEPEGAAFSGSPDLHLADLDVHNGTTLVFDDDAARRLVTQWLLRELAPILGIDPNRIEVHVDAAAASRNNARQTTGLIENGNIYIHPSGFDPESEAGRSLLAHEAVHAAQRRIAAPAVLHTKRAHAAAEHEAAILARAFSERTKVQRPRISLPLLVTAAAEDAPPALSRKRSPSGLCVARSPRSKTSFPASGSRTEMSSRSCAFSTRWPSRSRNKSSSSWAMTTGSLWPTISTRLIWDRTPRR